MDLLPEEMEQVRIALQIRVCNLTVQLYTAGSDTKIYIQRELAWAKLAFEKICQ